MSPASKTTQPRQARKRKSRKPPEEAPVPSCREVGQRIKAARERFGLSQDQAALRLGLHRITLLRLENQTEGYQYYPAYPTLFRLIERLGVTPTELFAPSTETDNHIHPDS